MNTDLLPGPPADLVHRSLPLLEFEGVLFRTHHIGRGPLYFGAGPLRSGKDRLSRFDSPDGGYGVLYAGRDAYCAFIEGVARTPGQVITTGALKQRALSQLKAVRPLRLIDLTEAGSLLRVGADARLFSGPHRASQPVVESVPRSPGTSGRTGLPQPA